MTWKLTGLSVLTALWLVIGAAVPARAGISLSFSDSSLSVDLPASGSIQVPLEVTATWFQVAKVSFSPVAPKNSGGDALALDNSVATSFINALNSAIALNNVSGSYTGTMLSANVSSSTNAGVYGAPRNIMIWLDQNQAGGSSTSFSYSVTVNATAVPEPATLVPALSGVALFGVGYARRRRRAAA